MSRPILDTSVLISFWRRRTSRSRRAPAVAEIETWARELIRLHDTDAIVTPVALEFVAGATSGEELGMFESFVQSFKSVDKRQVTSEDWDRAFRIAERVPTSGKPRHLGDCLIRALADRLRRRVITLDHTFPGKL